VSTLHGTLCPFAVAPAFIGQIILKYKILDEQHELVQYVIKFISNLYLQSSGALTNKS
jgi:hypothetical protein